MRLTTFIVVFAQPGPCDNSIRIDALNAECAAILAQAERIKQGKTFVVLSIREVPLCAA